MIILKILLLIVAIISFFSSFILYKYVNYEVKKRKAAINLNFDFRDHSVYTHRLNYFGCAFNNGCSKCKEAPINCYVFFEKYQEYRYDQQTT